MERNLKGFSGLLVRTFIKDFQNTQTDEVRAKYGYLNGWASLLINLVLAGVKFVLGFFSGSQALIADGLHSLGDLLTSLIVLFGFVIAKKPRDEKHPYGHANAELIASLIMSVLLIVAGFEFFRNGVSGLWEGQYHPIKADWITYLLLFGTILFKEWLWKFSKALSKAIDSKALEADAWHHRLDSLTTIVVLLGLFGSTQGILWLDDAVAISVSAVIIWSGIDLAKDSISPLLGENVPIQTIKEIRKIALLNPGIFNVHDVMVHQYGRKLFTSLHVEISEELSAVEMHDLAAEVQFRLMERFGGESIIHVDPIASNTPRYLEVTGVLNQFIESNEVLIEFHDLQFRDYLGTEVIYWEFSIDPSVMETEYPQIKEELAVQLQKIWLDSQLNFSLEPGYNIPA